MEVDSLQGVPASHEIKANLLARIDGIRNSNISNKKCTPNDLNPWEREYNGIMDQIRALSKGPLSDPLESFPEEIWENIIKESAHQVFYRQSYPIWVVSIEEILPLTLVSTGWRMAILGNPRFWTDVVLSDTAEDLETKIFLSIHLSKDFPLSICFNDESSGTASWEKVHHWIAPQKTRIRSLAMKKSSEITLILNTIGNLPLLQRLHRESWWIEDVDHEVIRTAESIRSITGLDASVQMLQYNSLNKIHTLQVRGYMEEFMPYLERLEHLRCVRMIVFSDDGIPNPIVLKGNNGKDQITSKSGPLSWSSLTLYGGAAGKYIEPLLLRVALTLLELDTSVEWSSVGIILLQCSSMLQLRLLTLAIGDTMTPFDPLSLPASTIENLHLTFAHNQDTEQYQYNINNLFTILTSWAPNVRIFTLISSARCYRSVFGYLCSLERLNSVELKDIRRDNEEIKRQGVNGVLKTQALVVHWPIELLTTTGVLSLELLSNTKKLKSGQWEHLRTLTVLTFAADWEGISLPNVTRIIFRKLAPNDFTKSSTSLCQEITKHPEIFPSLEYLAPSGPPEWEILFLMLERRNIFSDMKVERIKTVRLDLVPSLTILRPLTDLLGGRLTVYPSVSEISLSGKEGIFDDLNV